MAEVKKVLVIDDHFEMLELLRSMLELSNEECEVLAVPSAEEGMLELRRTHFDLVITDVRLPGMSGFDFVRRMHRFQNQAPVIMITAYSSTEGQKEAEELGVLRYFSKPLDTDAVLMAVQVALHGELQAPTEAQEITGETAVSEDVRKRLKSLRTDTGANGLMLSTFSGELIFQVASSQHTNLLALSQALSQTIQSSFALAEHLNTDTPNTIQYHAGERVELYCANIGHHYFLTIFFDVQSRRGRIGTIWVFTQRAIKDLMGLLPTVPKTSSKLTKVVQPGAAATPRQEAPRPPEPAPLPEPEPEVETAVVEDFLDLDVADLDDLFGDSDLVVETGAVDAFWEDAASEQEAPQISGLSLEEAQERGLFPSDLNLDE